MLDLENLSINENFFDDECSPDCFPFEKELNESLKSVQDKSPEELEKQWAEEDEKSQIASENYIEYLKNIQSDLLNNHYDEEDDDYSSGEDIPDCNPWRE